MIRRVNIAAEGTVIETRYPTLEQSKTLALATVKRLAAALIASIEGENPTRWRVERAIERDQMYDTYERQKLSEQIEVIRLRSDECEIDIEALGSPEEIADYDIAGRMTAAIDTSDVPAVLTNTRFLQFVGSTLESGDLLAALTRVGDILQDARTKANTNGGLRGVMERFDKAARVDKTDAAALLNILVAAGVNGFTAADRDLILSNWPTLE